MLKYSSLVLLIDCHKQTMSAVAPTSLLDPIVGTSLLVILDLFIFVSVYAYVSRIDQFPISKRLPLVVLVELFGALIISNTAILSGSFGATNAILGNCRANTITLSLGGNLVFISVTARFGWFIMKDFVTQHLIRLRDEDLSRRDTNCLSKLVNIVLKTLLSRMNIFQTVSIFLLPYVLNCFFQVVSISMSAGPLNSNLYTSNCVAILKKDPSAASGILGLAYLMATAVVISTSLLSIQDSMNMGTELKAMIVNGILTLASSSIWFLPLSLETRILTYGIMINGIEIPAFVVINVWYPVWLTFSTKQKLEETNTATGFFTPLLNISLEDLNLSNQLEIMIADPETRKDYLVFLEAEFAVENLYFYEECLHYEREVDMFLETNLLIQRVQVIHDVFISPSAPTSVNISSQVRNELVEFLKRSKEYSEGIPPRDLFFKAKKEILHVMSRDTFLRFKQTAPYKRFAEISRTELSKLASTLSFSPSGKHKSISERQLNEMTL
jgi:hypothetical protein